jgi:hypothetical protein
MHNHALSDATHIANAPPNRSPAKSIHSRPHYNRPPPTRHTLDILNARANDAEYPATHRFNFR